MAGTAVKVKAVAKPRHVKAKAATTNIRLVPMPSAKANHVEMRVVSHEEIAQLAHRYWEDRGHQHGKPELDWFRAEQELRGKTSQRGG